MFLFTISLGYLAAFIAGALSVVVVVVIRDSDNQSLSCEHV